MEMLISTTVVILEWDNIKGHDLLCLCTFQLLMENETNKHQINTPRNKPNQPRNSDHKQTNKPTHFKMNSGLNSVF